jgi:hypothetical protein
MFCFRMLAHYPNSSSSESSSADNGILPWASEGKVAAEIHLHGVLGRSELAQPADRQSAQLWRGAFCDSTYVGDEASDYPGT